LVFQNCFRGAVAAGIRRIEAITGDAVKKFYATQEILLSEIKMTLKNPQDVGKAVIALQEDNASLESN
jgi:alanyl-tRNA synthetase